MKLSLSFLVDLSNKIVLTQNYAYLKSKWENNFIYEAQKIDNHHNYIGNITTNTCLIKLFTYLLNQLIEFAD